MGKHRFRNKIKSILGSDIDPDKDEELKGSNIEMEDNYQKILELLKEEDKDDKNKLVGLIEDFHKHHQSIYERYDHITGELRAKVHSKKEKDSSSSSSSDSDSDDSSSKKGSKNGKMKVADILKEELQASHTDIDELTRKLAVATEEKEALGSEYQAALNKEQETEKKFVELKLEAERLHEENSKLLADNSDLNLKSENARILEAEFSQKLEDMSREKSSLLSEKETAAGTLEELRAVIDRLEGENEDFKSELGVVKAELPKMKEKLETTEEELSSISQTLEATEADKKSLADEIKMKHVEIQELAAECSQLREKLADKEKELLSHAEMHNSHKSETEIKMRGYEVDFESLHSQKREIEKQKEEELSTLAKKSEDKERELLSQIENLTENVSNLQKELESFGIQKSQLDEHVQALLVKVNEKQEEIAILCRQKLESERQLEKSSQEISGYLIQIDSLKQELADKMADERKFLEEKEVHVAREKDLEEEVKWLHSLKAESETEVSKKTQEIAEYINQIENFKEEAAKMTMDQSKTVEEKEGYESRVKDLELELESLNNLKAESESQLEKKGTEISELLILSQSLKEELQSKSKDQAKTMEEKEGYESRVKDLELKLESLNNLKDELEGQLEKKGTEISEFLILSQSLKEEIENKSKHQAKTIEEKESYESRVKDLELELESLNNLKAESESQLEKKGTEISELLILSQSLKEELQSKSKDQAKTMEEKEGYESRVKDLELKLESLNNLKDELEGQLEKKGTEISEFLILSQSLKEEIENKSKHQAKTIEEKESYESKVKDLELQLESLNNLKNESEMQLEKKGVEISELVILSQSLKEELESKCKDQAKTVEEKEGYESRVKDLELKLESLNNLKDELESQLEKKGTEISEFLILSQSLKEEIENKSKHQAKTMEEKESYESKVKDLELQLESLNNLKNESEVQLEKKGVEISELVILSQSLKEELESKCKDQAKTVEEKEGYESRVKDLELKLESLNNLKDELESQLEKKGTEISEFLILSQSLKEEIENKSKHQAKTMEEKESYESKVKDLELQLESLNNLINESEVQLEKKGVEISELVILSQSLKEELESKCKDQAKTVEEKEGYESQVKDLELKLESLNHMKEELESQLEKKGTEISELLLLSQSLKDEIESKSKDQAKTLEEKESHESKVRDLELELGSLNSLKNESEMELQKKCLEISELVILSQNLKEELESKSKDQAKTLEEKGGYESKVNDLESKLEVLSNLKNELEMQLEKKGTETSELLILSQNLKEEIEVKSKDQAKTLEEKESFESKVKDLELKIESLEKLKNESEMQLEKNGTEISELLTQSQSLKEELESKSKDLEKTMEEKDSFESKVKDLELKLESLEKLKHESELHLEKKGLEHSALTVLSRSLKEELESKSKDHAKTAEEKEGYATMVKDLELKLESFKNLKNESEMQLEKKVTEISELLILSESLKEELESKSKDLEKTMEEKEGYESKVKDLESKLESLENLKTESEMHITKKGLELSEFIIVTQSLKEELESKSRDQAKTLEEKELYATKANELEKELASLVSLKEELANQFESEKLDNLQLQKQLEDKIQELETVFVEKDEKLSKHENEASTQIASLTEQINTLQKEIDSLSAQKSETESKLGKTLDEKNDLELQIERSKQEYSEKLAELENQKLELENKIASQEIAIKSLEDASSKQNEEQKRLEACLQDAERKIKEMEEEIETVTQSKNETVEQLEEAIEDLKGELEIKGDEVTTLTENVRNLEVKIRLANQKLRVTEQTLNEKEGDHAGKEEKLHQENKSLIERISTLSETISSYKEAEESVKREISEKANAISGGMDSLTVKFEEDHGHISTQIYEILNEIQVTKISIKTMRSEKDDLKEKVAKIAIQLKAVENEKAKLQKSVDELEQKTKGKDNKIKELEKLVHVRDEGLMDLGEEKREAIRQLCMLVDYQRDRYDELLSKKTSVGRRQTTR